MLRPARIMSVGVAMAVVESRATLKHHLQHEEDRAEAGECQPGVGSVTPCCHRSRIIRTIPAPAGETTADWRPQHRGSWCRLPGLQAAKVLGWAVDHRQRRREPIELGTQVVVRATEAGPQQADATIQQDRQHRDEETQQHWGPARGQRGLSLGNPRIHAVRSSGISVRINVSLALRPMPTRARPSDRAVRHPNVDSTTPTGTAVTRRAATRSSRGRGGRRRRSSPSRGVWR